MKILVTGARGFMGRNLCAELRNVGYSEADILEFDLDSDPLIFEGYAAECEFVFHLAGVNRPESAEEFMEGNFGFTSVLLEALERHGNTCPVMISSSIQALLDNPYGKSKKAGEDLLFDYSARTGANANSY